MEIAILSDIHDNLKNLQKVTDQLIARGIKTVICCGDFCAPFVMKQLGATKTPEVFLFNSKRELVYKGAIDDSWDNESTVMSVYLDDAIEYTLDGIDIDYPEVEAEGCSIKWK